MPRITILGFSLQVPEPYAEGHVCTQAEADSLNRLLTTRISKGVYRVLSGGCASLGFTSAQQMNAEEKVQVLALGEEFIATFSLGFAEGHERLRAIETEAKRIARGMAEVRLYKQGRKISEVPNAELEALIAECLNIPTVQTEAKRRIDDVQKIAREAHQELMSEGE